MVSLLALCFKGDTTYHLRHLLYRLSRKDNQYPSQKLCRTTRCRNLLSQNDAFYFFRMTAFVETVRRRYSGKSLPWYQNGLLPSSRRTQSWGTATMKQVNGLTSRSGKGAGVICPFGQWERRCFLQNRWLHPIASRNKQLKRKAVRPGEAQRNMCTIQCDGLKEGRELNSVEDPPTSQALRSTFLQLLFRLVS